MGFNSNRKCDLTELMLELWRIEKKFYFYISTIFKNIVWNITK